MRIELRALAQVICQVFELEDISLAKVDAQWGLLQAWLTKNPRWKVKLARWVKLPTETAYVELRDWVSEEGAIAPVMLKAFIAPEVEARIKTALNTLHVLHLERAHAPNPRP